MDGSELCEHVSYDITEMLRFLTTTSEQSFHGTAHCTPTQWHQFCAPLMLHWSLGPPLRFAQVDFRHNSAHSSDLGTPTFTGAIANNGVQTLTLTRPESTY